MNRPPVRTYTIMVPTYTVVAGRDEYRVHRSRELAERVARALGGYIRDEQWAESLAA